VLVLLVLVFMLVSSGATLLIRAGCGGDAIARTLSSGPGACGTMLADEAQGLTELAGSVRRLDGDAETLLAPPTGQRDRCGVADGSRPERTVVPGEVGRDDTETAVATSHDTHRPAGTA
jgi:hypothetical protein